MAKLSDVEKVINMIKKHDGNVSVCANNLGVTRNTLYALINSNEEVKQALDDAREAMIDTVESSLYSNAKNGDNVAAIFFLKTQAKHRGYTEKQINLNVDVTNLSDEDLERIINS